MTHRRFLLCEPLLSPVRFSIAALLFSAEQLEFGFARNHTQISDQRLNRQVTELERVEMLVVKKGYIGKGPYARLTFSAVAKPSTSTCRPRPASPRARRSVAPTCTARSGSLKRARAPDIKVPTH